MAAVADKNVGFAGQVLTADWAVIAGRGSRYSCTAANDLRVVVAAGDRAVSVAAAPGGVWGDGVLSTWTTGATLNAATISSGSRWDTIVIRRNWSNSTATLMVLQGGASRAVAAGRQRNAGTGNSDQPIALIRVTAGQSAVQEIVDLRCWAGAGGGLTIVDEAALGYLDELGTRVSLRRTLPNQSTPVDLTWTRVMGSTGTPQWVRNIDERAMRVTGHREVLTGAGPLDQGYIVQAETRATTSQGNGRVVNMAFPHTFPHGVISVVAVNGDYDAAKIGIGMGTVRRSNFDYMVYRLSDGQPAGNIQHRINYVAVGW